MDDQNTLQQIVEPSTGSSVILDPPKVESDQEGEFFQEIEQKKQHRLKLKFGAMPKAQRRVLIASALGVIVVVGAVMATVSALGGAKVDYGESYRTAKALRIKIQKMRSDYDCQKVLDYVDNSYTTMAIFNGYVEGCRNTGDDSSDLVEELSLTEGVKKNEDIAMKYNVFKQEYEAVVEGGRDLSKTLDLYVIWHNWVIAEKKIEEAWDQTDADLTTTAKILIDSGDDVLKKYGEGWLSRRQAAAKAWREYYAADYGSEEREKLRKENDAKQKDYNTFVAEHRPNIAELEVLKLADTASLYSKFESMYEDIRKAYQENYDKESGDCRELIGEVICD